ncbi:MAG: mechanosensitive ion channel protein MscL [Actinobacteria bacterium 13_2_20CM_2_71_6]|nr:MAG: mechanosensitive ion channel protein MscL [Actinobacteria bacterium 13_2_20CM_2_71_6]
MLKGFKDFIMRGNVIDLAVGIVIGAAFTTLVQSFTNGFMLPIIKRLGGGGDIGGKIKIGGGQALDWGGFVNAVITFLITAAVLYFFFVMPMNKLAERRRRGEEPPPETPSDEVQLLTEIRDALVRGTPAQRDVPVYPSDAPDEIKSR